MKTHTICLAAVTAVAVLFPLHAARAGTSFSFGISISSVSDFYEPLGAQGQWIEVADYGRCWRPAYIAADWQPYANGHWEWTDQGWYWASDEPWAWATYHYGRWVYDPYRGWLWIPGVEWAPAWVAWREGGGYCGWAPMPPARFCGDGGIVIWERVHWMPRAFVFVEFGRFCDPVRRYHAPVAVNQTIINKTVNITNVRVENNRGAFRSGPSVETVERRVGHRLEAQRLPERIAERLQATPARVERATTRVEPHRDIAVRAPEQNRNTEPRRETTVVRPPEQNRNIEPQRSVAPTWRQRSEMAPATTGTRQDTPVTRRAAEPARVAPEQRSAPVTRQDSPAVTRRETPVARQDTTVTHRETPVARQDNNPVAQRREFRSAPQPTERPGSMSVARERSAPSGYSGTTEFRGNDRRSGTGYDTSAKDRFAFGNR